MSKEVWMWVVFCIMFPPLTVFALLRWVWWNGEYGGSGGMAPPSDPRPWSERQYAYRAMRGLSRNEGKLR